MIIKKETLLQLLKERKEEAIKAYTDTPYDHEYWMWSGREDELEELIEIIKNMKEV